MPRSNDWVVAVSGGGAWCKRCDTRVEVKLPMEVGVWVAMMRAFSKAHARCKEQR
jgi:hypothetical protein